MNIKYRLSSKEKVDELKKIANNICLFINEIKNNQNLSLVNSLAVELRKLFDEKNPGNNLLERLENDLNIKLKFPDKKTRLPPQTTHVSIDDYKNNLVFSSNGRGFTRIEIIKILADKKGAHLDDQQDIIIKQSEKIFLPFGNPAKTKLILEQNHYYLLAIAITTIKVINEQIFNKYL
ncbi:hypothetical protein GYA49_05795 [Candidatus Beckwithbacteria bacterium]|nr:hypothetical protein [Candidatus Beckwithbacteria bacterium]